MRLECERVADTLREFSRLPKIFSDTFSNTFSTTLKPQPDGSVFVITGDIPAMWLRDSAAQVRPYLRLAESDGQFSNLIAGVVKKQIANILIDPYANAFNETASDRCHNRDDTAMGDWIWERKYELDSLCAPITLAHDLWQMTKRTDHLDENFVTAAKLIIATIALEQDHTISSYRFQRHEGPPSDTLTHGGFGNPVGYTGMSWSGFRPSDDACKYNYLVPSNMLAVVALDKLFALPLRDDALKSDAKRLASDIRGGIETFAKIRQPNHATIFAYEVDGLGNHHMMDDANVPSLLAMPYMGFCAKDDPTYLATRSFVLSEDNPYFYKGATAKGIGSPHTPHEFIWPIALCVQGLTATSKDEKKELLETLLRTDAGAGLMHESFHKDDPSRFTRPWFAWANSLFAEFVIGICDEAT